MPDPAATADVTSTPDVTSGADTTDTPAATDDNVDLGAKRALDAMRKELREAKLRTRELEEADRARQDAERTELEKATGRAETAEQRIAELEHEALAREVATENGIAKHWRRLIGKTRDELEADAKQFLADREADEPQPERPDFGAGARPATPVTGRAGFNEAIRRQHRR
jgi:hypothetical protein